jgi:hypothetical protein
MQHSGFLAQPVDQRQKVLPKAFLRRIAAPAAQGMNEGMKPSGGSRRALAASQMVTWVLTLASALSANVV